MRPASEAFWPRLDFSAIEKLVEILERTRQAGRGDSPNVLRALEYAHAHGGTTIGLTGFDGGQMKGLFHLCVHVETPRGEYGPVEDIHLILDQLLILA